MPCRGLPEPPKCCPHVRSVAHRCSTSSPLCLAVCLAQCTLKYRDSAHLVAPFPQERSNPNTEMSGIPGCLSTMAPPGDLCRSFWCRQCHLQAYVGAIVLLRFLLLNLPLGSVPFRPALLGPSATAGSTPTASPSGAGTCTAREASLRLCNARRPNNTWGSCLGPEEVHSRVGGCTASGVPLPSL